jgi:nickel-dependent lactate racemase
VVNHDSRDEGRLVEVGRTSRGTRLRVNRCLAEADVIVTTGRIKPHYFAGYGGGTKGIFPGLGAEADIRQNHLLKAEPGSALGRADLNPCREDLEEAARRLGRDTFMLDVVEAGGRILGAVAGDIVLAHREGVRRLRPWVEVEAPRADVVIVSAPLPVAASLARAARLVPPAGLLVEEGGVVILAVECPDGAGADPTAEEGAWAGVRRYLPARSTLIVVSSLGEAAAAQVHARSAPTLAAALEEARRLTGPGARVLVLPDATDLVPIPADSIG